MLCKVTLGVMKGAPKLNVSLLFIKILWLSSAHTLPGPYVPQNTDYDGHMAILCRIIMYTYVSYFLEFRQKNV